MFRVYAVTVRSIYLLMVVSTLAVGGWAFREYLSAFLRPGNRQLSVEDLVVIGFLLAYLVPAARAAIRLARVRELVPDAHLRERPVVAALVTIPAAIGVFLLYVVSRFWLDIQPWGGDDVGGPLGGAFILALLMHVFAMLTGEIVLVGGTPSPGTGRSDPVC